jgi:hypothetical protein
MWLYYAAMDRLMLFDYRKGKGQSDPKEMLADFKGIIQADGYKVYDSLCRNHPDIHLTFCMAHARCKFEDALNDDWEQAGHVLVQIQHLYALEQRMRNEFMGIHGLGTANKAEKEIYRVLPDKTWEMAGRKPIQLQTVKPDGKGNIFSKSIFMGLSAYTLHRQMEVDNNLVDNAVRDLWIGRKAYLFAVSHQAAKITAAVYYFMASCKTTKSMNLIGSKMSLKESSATSRKTCNSLSR